MARQYQVERATKVPEIRKGDTVVVLKGRDAGKRGVVDRVVRQTAAPSASRTGYRRTSTGGGVSVVIDGINIAKKHTKARQRTQGGPGSMPTVDPGGVLDQAMPVPVGKVMLVCPKCGQPTRIGHQTLDNGRRVRICRHCGQALEAVR